MEEIAPKQKLPSLLIIVVMAGLFYVLGQYVASQPLRVEQEVQANREITVTGIGEVTARPDVARITVTVRTGPLATAVAATNDLSKRINAVIEAVKREGVAEEDIKTQDLSINPQYDYREGKQTLRGYEAVESLEITIRDLDKIGTVLARSTAEGVNQAGGVRFEIDDPDELQIQAQEAAITDARDKAEQLAKTLGVRLGRVKTFSAVEGGDILPPVFARAELVAEAGLAAPEVPSGTQDVTATVTITFELK